MGGSGNGTKGSLRTVSVTVDGGLLTLSVIVTVLSSVTVIVVVETETIVA